ncbi:hypothetical protein NEOLEDRAFT_1183247 [Neolentinus lepideus HHB14362 ss-1]|uniref:Uncharacterized protein n=1 Tax=Neolentinus lepideus HHB14362 ss-1 TaxID=1314782 RepID=A0A165NGP6_9AGAM|nr:hypothetical protein NEOLEDRAFT_1183247 [Neolentinus lepideus HHB14362 ss-1]
MDDDVGENMAETAAIENEEEPLEDEGLAEPLEDEDFDYQNQGYDGDQFDNGDVEADDRIGFMHTEDDMHNTAEFILSDKGDDTQVMEIG